MKKVLVTGAAGFVGSHIVDECIERGYEVYGIDNFSTGKRENINPACIFTEADIREFDYNSIKVDGVFHTAALARIQPSFHAPLKYESVNVLGTLRIIQYCVESKAKLMFSSSSSVYGVKGRLPAPMDESYPLNPSSPYALQKRHCEEYLDLFHLFYGLRYVAFRYFNVYGPRQIMDGAYAAVVGIFLDQFRKGTPFTIYGDGKQRRDFTFVKDVAKANVLGFEANIDSGIYNIGSGANQSVLDLANFISRDNPINFMDERLGEAQETLADYRKAYTHLNWQPRMTLKNWIENEVIKA